MKKKYLSVCLVLALGIAVLVGVQACGKASGLGVGGKLIVNGAGF